MSAYLLIVFAIDLLLLALVVAGAVVLRKALKARWGAGVAILPLLALADLALGFVVTIVLLLRSFRALASIEPARKAAVLSEGIAHAMGFGALICAVSLPLIASALLMLLVGWNRSRPSMSALGEKP